MIMISLCMIVKDEEDSLGRCLDSVQTLVDEIIIVDTGSTDKTKEIAAQYNAKIYDFVWINDFAAARNYSFSLATMDYIWWLDADDVLLEGDQQKLLQLKSTFDTSIDSLAMNYHLNSGPDGQATFSMKRNRIVRRSCGFQWHGFVHEYLVVHGKVVPTDIAITHKKNKVHTTRNLDIYEEHRAKQTAFSPRETYYYANELKDHGQFDNAVTYYQAFLDTKQGWIEDILAASCKIADCYEGLGKIDEAMTAAMKSLEYAVPRPDSVYRIGRYFMLKNAIEQAIFWLSLAAKLEAPENWGMQHKDYSTWLPHLQLCVCYYRQGDMEKSYFHNEIALSYRPDDQSMLNNRKLLLPLQPGNQ
ncbi:Tetratricopeptide repeat-containing protein [Paenibacillus sp. 1_12]|uniref:glycosyltransferase n=1 Tax=Paenibacillus sp. 1_12 TaxID=1566278 RepID=UPI0008EDDF02|nr:glycosyltransferase family 2 protein [Paenibacillus sp. 1_12]SFK72147.1 Tetratricopeptide repeat-containing protein [Paenibacillus sp. 1_12]